MTQPVQEPTQGRVNQSLDYRSRQLFRRPTSAGCVPVTNSDYAASVLSDNPKLYWQMQDCYEPTGLGVCIDSSGNGYDADANVNPTRQRADGALLTSTDVSFGDFYADADVATWQLNSGLTSVVDDFSIEGWVRTDFSTGRGSSRIWSLGYGVTFGWRIKFDAATRKFRYECSGVGNGSYSAQALCSNAWYHIAVVRDSGTWMYYINGALDTASAGTHTPGSTTGGVFLVYFGGCVTNQSHAAFYESPLTAGEVDDHFDAKRNT